MTQSIYYATNILGGSNSVTVSFSQAADYADIRILEFAGLSPAWQLDVTASASGASSNDTIVRQSSGLASTTSAHELIFGAGHDRLGIRAGRAIVHLGRDYDRRRHRRVHGAVSAPGTYGATRRNLRSLRIRQLGDADGNLQISGHDHGAGAPAPPPSPPPPIPAPDHHSHSTHGHAFYSGRLQQQREHHGL